MELFTFIHHFFFTFSSLCSHPLFSTIVTLYTLLLLYAPSLFLTIAFSPVLNSAGIVLLSLLRLGANERSEKESNSQELETLDSSENERSEKESNSMESRFLDFIDENQTDVGFEPKVGLGLQSNQTHVEFEPKCGLDMQPNQTDVEFEYDLGSKSNSQGDHHKLELLETNSMESSPTVEEGEAIMELDQKLVSFLEWNMKAPLEIIYEAYEGEEEEESDENNEVSNDKKVTGCERYPSLSTYYPESDSSSDDDVHVNENWEWKEEEEEEEEEEEQDELIEISLDRYGKKSIEFCYADEDNMIEIDIFPARD